MPYFIGYKGKKLGPPLSRTDAEEKLAQLSRCFNQLEIIKEHRIPPPLIKKTETEIAATFIHPIFESTLYSERR